MDDRALDRELVEVYNELIGLVQEAKQAAWQATQPDAHAAFTELRNFLGQEARQVEEAEEAIDGRSDDLLSPTGMKVRNLRAVVGDAPGAVNAQLVEDLRSVAADVRRRAVDVGDAPAAGMFLRLADGLDEHTARLGDLARP